MYVSQIAYIITIESYSSIKLNLVSTIVQLQRLVRVHPLVVASKHTNTHTHTILPPFLSVALTHFCSYSFAMYSVSMVLGLFQFAIVLCRLMSLHWHWHCFELLLWFAFNPSKIEYYYTEFSGWIENIYASRHQEQHTYTGWKQCIAMQSCKSAPSCSSNFETDLYFSLVPSFFYPFLSLHSSSIFCLFLLFFLFFFLDTFIV